MTKKTVGMYGGKFLPPHMGHVYAATKASAYVDELYIVVCYNPQIDKLYCQNSKDIPYIPGPERVRMWTRIMKDLPHVKVIGVGDHETSEDKYDWDLGGLNIKKAIGKEIDFVFGSEPEYATYFNANFPGSEYITIDSARKYYPISATKIREEGVFNNWNFIPNEIKPWFIKRVVLIGTESCGKSTLTKNLARLYNTTYVPEYGRTVCEDIGGEDVMVEEDFNRIALHQHHVEQEAIKNANKLVFIDTETMITQYYSELILGKRLPLLDAIIKEQSYDMILFFEPDVDWVDDGTRTHGDAFERKQNNVFLKNMLKRYGVQYHTIDGSYYERLEKCFDLVNTIRYN